MIRKYLSIIIIIFLLLGLGGCGLFNLAGWVFPDDLGFTELINELNTPKKIGNYMLENFEYEEHSGAYNPYTLWQIKKGDCLDFSIFAMFMAYQNNIEAYQIYISYKDISFKHVIVAYVENDYYLITSNQNYFTHKFNTFREIVNFDSGCRLFGWSEYTVRNYWNNLIEKGEK